jgi:transcriptional regulator with XRE-family HTH domain
MNMSEQPHGDRPVAPTLEPSHEELLGSRLREAREYLGLSQEFVAEQLNIPRASISTIETGKRKVSTRELSEFARLYKTSVPILLAEDEYASSTQDETVTALFRATKELTDNDRQQVLRFAQFLRTAGSPPDRHH